MATLMVAWIMLVQNVQLAMNDDRINEDRVEFTREKYLGLSVSNIPIPISATMAIQGYFTYGLGVECKIDNYAAFDLPKGYEKAK